MTNTLLTDVVQDKLSPHQGYASNGAGTLRITLRAPQSGSTRFRIEGAVETLPPRGFNEGPITFAGDSEDGLFTATIGQYGVVAAPPQNRRLEFGIESWAIAIPRNEPVIIEYGSHRDVRVVEALINNFDFGKSNACALDKIGEGAGPALSVMAGQRNVVFRRYSGYDELLLRARTGEVKSPALCAFEFAVAPEESDDSMRNFAHDVAALCSVASGQHTGLPVVTMLDEIGHPVRRYIGDPIESALRVPPVLDPKSIPHCITQLFQECFDEFVRMRQSALRWDRLVSELAAIEDPPYLEQKFASLMMAVEFFMKASLRESPAYPTPGDLSEKSFKDLIAITRKHLQWDTPKHYTIHERVRKLRNAVMHGGNLPTVDQQEFRSMFDKWRLFLHRRVLIRLGYSGDVASVEGGWKSSSSVDEFSADHNTFDYNAVDVASLLQPPFGGT